MTTSPMIMVSPAASTVSRMRRISGSAVSWWVNTTCGMPTMASGTSWGCGSLPMALMTSMRNPSTPRSSQNRRTSCWASSTSGLAQFRSGCSGRKRWSQYWPVVSSSVHADPPSVNDAVQFVGGPPPGAASAQMNQSRLGFVRLLRDSTNHGWSLETWLGTKSTISLIPRSCRPVTTRSKSSKVPKTGSTAQWSEMS